MYLNDLFAGNNSWKLMMLVQPKCNAKCGCKCIRYQGPIPWNRVDNMFKFTAIYNEWSLVCTCYFCDFCSLETL